MEASALRAPDGLSRLPVPSALLRLRSDEQLVALFRQGDEDAFRVIHDRYRVRLLAYARQMLGGSRTDAEDALQDVFLRAYGALRADERPIALRAWLYRVAHNRCIDHLRRPTPRDEDVFDLSRTPPADPLAETERRDDLRRLLADVRRLPDQQRSALLMRELEGLSYADLATALDVTIPAVKSLLVRARMGLAEAQEARDTACTEIREELAVSFERGQRASGRSRRHVRECGGCEHFRAQLRGVRAGLHSLAPVGGPLALLAQLLGLGGAGSAAGGAAAVGGGGAAAVGGITVSATTAQVAAVVASAAIAAGGAVEVREVVGDRDRERRGAPAEVRAPAPAGTGGDARVLRAIGATVAGPAVVAPHVRPAAGDDDSGRAAAGQRDAVARSEAGAERATVEVDESVVVVRPGTGATEAGGDAAAPLDADGDLPPLATGGTQVPGEPGVAGPGEPESSGAGPAGSGTAPGAGTAAGTTAGPGPGPAAGAATGTGAGAPGATSASAPGGPAAAAPTARTVAAPSPATAMAPGAGA